MGPRRQFKTILRLTRYSKWLVQQHHHHTLQASDQQADCQHHCYRQLTEQQQDRQTDRQQLTLDQLARQTDRQHQTDRQQQTSLNAQLLLSQCNSTIVLLQLQKASASASRLLLICKRVCFVVDSRKFRWPRLDVLSYRNSPETVSYYVSSLPAQDLLDPQVIKRDPR